MDDLFWIQAYGDRDALLSSVADQDARRFIEINYGPWDRLVLDEPVLTGLGSKPYGAGFYPADMTRNEFESVADRDAAWLERRESSEAPWLLWLHLYDPHLPYAVPPAVSEALGIETVRVETEAVASHAAPAPRCSLLCLGHRSKPRRACPDT